MSLATTLGYKVEYYGTGSSSTDITSYIESIDKFTDVGNGEVPTAQIMLDCRDGEFITQNNGGNTPIISQYDVLYITIEDDYGLTYKKFFYQDDVQPQKNDTGRHLVLNLVGMEGHLQNIYFTGYYPFVTFREILFTIQTFYNTAKGDNQPSLLFAEANGKDIRNVPKNTLGTFDFGFETTIYDALQEVMTRFGLPVPAFGAGERYSLVTANAVAVDRTTIIYHITPRGNRRPRSPDNPVVVNPMNLTRIKSPEEGNIVVLHGQPGTGSYPAEIAEFRGLIEEYENIPFYDSAVDYKKGAIVRLGDNKVYQAAIDEPPTRLVPGGVAQEWNLCTFSNYVGIYKNGWNLNTGTTGPPNSSFQYSPWTHGKARAWRNWGGKPYGNLATGYTGGSFTDSNLVVRESGTGGDGVTVWRDWVDFKLGGSGGQSTIPSQMGGTAYDGMRVLVLASNTVININGRDRFGKPYRNSMCMYWQGSWIVFREAHDFDQCVVIYDGETWEVSEPHGTVAGATQQRATRKSHLYRAGETKPTFAWRQSTHTTLGNDAFHYPSTVTNVDGLITADVGTDNFIPLSYTQQSAIEIKYEHAVTLESLFNAYVIAPLEQLSSDIWSETNGVFGQDDTTAELREMTPAQIDKLYEVDTYNEGWWCTLFESPYPKTTHGIGESVGDLYKPALLDLYNLNQTPTGKVGYQADDADLLGSFDGIAFFLNFDIRGATLQDFEGNIPFRCFVYDIFGGVFKSDFVIRFQNETQFIKIPFSSFTNHRSRLPIAYRIANWFHRARNPELRETEVLQNHYIKRIGLHCLLSYDDWGRYDPNRLEGIFNKILPTFLGGIDFIGRVDALHFTKTPVAIERAGNISDRHTMPPIKKYPNISNVIQLQKIARAELDIAQHQPDQIEFQIDDQHPSVPVCGYVAEQTVRITDDAFIAESEDVDGTSTANTRNYIVDKITYSVGDRSTGSGLVATIRASRRIAT